MSKHILYNGGWNLSLITGFDKKVVNFGKSIFNDKGTNVTLFHPALKAYIMYCLDGVDPSRVPINFNEKKAGVTFVNEDGVTIAEYRSDAVNTHLCAFDSKKKEILWAGVTSDGGNSYSRYTLDFTEGRNGTVIWLAMIPYLARMSKEICTTLKDGSAEIMSAYLALTNCLSRNAQRLAATFCDSCYQQIGLGKSMVIDVNIPSSGILPEVPVDLVKAGAYKYIVDIGQFTVSGMCEKNTNMPVRATTADDLFCKYSLDENISEEDKLLIPKMPSWYVVPKWVEKAAHNVQYHYRNAKLSSGIKQNNLFLFGEPGSGKSEGSKAIASALGLPFTHISMSANSDEFVFTGNIIPKVNVEQEEVISKYGDVDSLLEAIDLSPDTVYKDLTGQANDNATVADCIEAYAKCSTKGNSVSYTFVESDFAKAIEKGWFVTIEEFTNVRDAGIAMVINQLMDGYQQITLPTGKVIKRNPKSVIAFASNVDEAQCGEFEASTLSRLKPMYKVETPNKIELIQRVSKMTDFSDPDLLDKMADVVLQLRAYIKEHALVGVCGVREFAGWILQYQANKDFDTKATLREAAMESIVPSASPHEEDIEEIIRDIIDTML